MRMNQYLRMKKRKMILTKTNSLSSKSKYWLKWKKSGEKTKPNKKTREEETTETSRTKIKQSKKVTELFIWFHR